MTIEVEVLNEMYSIVKQYVPTKDRQECADNVMSIMVDMLSDHDLKEFGSSDATLKRAMQEYVDNESEDDDDPDW
jgi:hypothetical protein